MRNIQEVGRRLCGKREKGCSPETEMDKGQGGTDGYGLLEGKKRVTVPRTYADVLAQTEVEEGVLNNIDRMD